MSSKQADRLAAEIEAIHGETVCVVMSAERYNVADRIAAEVITVRPPEDGVHKKSLTDRLDQVALHPFLGYFAVFLVIGGLLVWTFVVGARISDLIQSFLSQIEPYEPVITGPVTGILWNGAFSGFVAGVTLVIPYVLPFYLLLAVMEDSGYLTRIAVMLDRGMHKLGLHGKAVIPLILGYGCNVPACFSCRIMESPKQKLLAAFLVTLIPCTARTVVILGLVGKFVSIWWALALYAFDIVLIIIVGRIAFKVVPGESVGLIMEMPDYHVPSASVVVKQTWARTKSLIWFVFPAYIVGSASIQVFYAVGLLTPVNNLLAPVTVFWLGLPGYRRDHPHLRHREKRTYHPHPRSAFRVNQLRGLPHPRPAHRHRARLDALYPLHIGHPGARLGVRVETVACDLLYRGRPRYRDRRDRLQAAWPVHGMSGARGYFFYPILSLKEGLACRINGRKYSRCLNAPL